MAYDAVKNGNLDAILAMGDVSTIRNDKNENVMHIAARCGQLNILEYLLTTYPQLLTMTSNRGNTMLHYAVKSRHLPMVTKLLPLCDNFINIRSTKTRTPLQLAVGMGFCDAAAVIISQKPTSVDQYDNSQQSILHGAVFSKDVATVRYLLTVCPPGMLKSTDVWGRTPLYCACERTSLEIVKLLFEADPTAFDIPDNVNLLPMFSVLDVAIMTFLLQVRPHAIDAKWPLMNFNVLYNSCQFADTGMTEFLLRTHPALLNEVVDGESVLQFAFRVGRYEHVKAILRFKPDLVETYKSGKNNVLHIAVDTCDYDVIAEVFRHHVAALYCRNPNFDTPFDLAILTKNRKVVELFQPHVTFDMACEVSDWSIANCGIDLVAYAMNQCKTLNTLLLPDIAKIVFQYLGVVVKKRKRDTK